ncbi:MAG: sulfatase-like hydrolase/transferase [Pseudomonadota bacterium]
MALQARIVKRGIWLACGAAVVFCALALPNHPDAVQWRALGRWPLEFPVILLTMLVVGRLKGVAAALAVALGIMTLVKLADIAMFMAYDRSFNPILDMFLLDAAFNLLSASIGTVTTIAAAYAAVLAIAIWTLALHRSLLVWANVGLPAMARAAAAVCALGLGAWAGADAAYHLDTLELEKSPPGNASTARLSVEKLRNIRETADDLIRFRALAEQDEFADAAGLLDRLDGRDVILIWIESYGRASFDNPLYAPTHLATLAQAEQALASAGLAMRSGWLTSPTAGGQSWLAHGALASGLWTSDQGRYAAMLASGHKWLFHFAREAGYRTAAIMPAITLAWPEVTAMGFDDVFPAADIPYQGDPFHWVTMPDQFTLAAYPSLLHGGEQPRFVQVALISSHAPWVPVPDVIAWDAVGDGRVFNPMAARGPTPRALWKDRDDVRDAYRKAVNYALTVTFEHVARLGSDAPLVIVAGDHQPAKFVAQSENKDVALHMVGPPDLIAAIEAWGWSDGLIPDSESPARRMDWFRNAFLRAFTSQDALAGRAE